MKNKWMTGLIVFLVIIVVGLTIWIVIRRRKPAATEIPTEQAPTGDISAIEFPSSSEEINWEDRDVFRSGLVPEAQEILQELPQASTYYISLVISQEFPENITGSLIVRFFNAENEPLEEIYFRLFPNFQGGRTEVSRVLLDGKEAETALESEDTALRVTLTEALTPGESVVISMDFSLMVPIEMGGNYGIYGFFGDVLVLDVFYPVIPAYDENGWYKEYPQANGDHTYLDASFYVVQVQAPADLVLASSGVVVDRQESGEHQTVIYAAGPARDFYLAGSREYTELKEQVGDLTVKVYTREEYVQNQVYALDYALDAIEIFTKRLGDYPYTEFEVNSSPMRAGAVEYPGITNVLVNYFIPDAMIGELPTQVLLEWTIAHEVGHMWFYNTVGNDQQNEPWLDEALVQYITYIYYLDKYGSGQGNIDSWYGRTSRVENKEMAIGLPAGEYEGAEYGAIIYGRGPLFFLELEKELGLEVVMAAIRDYYQDHLWGIGQPEDLLSALEEACDCELDEIYNEWVIGTEGDESSETNPVEGWAVLAAKDDYSDVGMTDMLVDYIDNTRLLEALEKSGWNPNHIHEVREFNRESLQTELDWLEEVADENDLVFLYVTSHGKYLSDIVLWGEFFPEQWEEIASQRRVLVVDSCSAGKFTKPVTGDPNPYLSIAAVDSDEFGWKGLEEEGLPIVGGVFTYYFAQALTNPDTDDNGDGFISVQEAVLLAEEQQRAYMHEVVFAVPEFVEMYHGIGVSPELDPTFPDVILDDTIGEPFYLSLDAYP